MNVPFYKPSIGEDEIAEVVATLRSGWLTTGPRTREFEAQFAVLGMDLQTDDRLVYRHDDFR